MVDTDQLMVLVHSPFLGASAWGWVARELEQRGRRAVVPSLRPVVDEPYRPWRDVWETLDAVSAHRASKLVLVGHSHVPLAIVLSDDEFAGGHAPGGTDVDLGTDARLLLNPGSVGQPRDGDPRAAWLLLDFGSGRAQFRRASYPVERTQEEIRERGLPDALAERLARGV